jgi:hypothetical protein
MDVPSIAGPVADFCRKYSLPPRKRAQRRAKTTAKVLRAFLEAPVSRVFHPDQDCAAREPQLRKLPKLIERF